MEGDSAGLLRELAAIIEAGNGKLSEPSPAVSA
jgi:hypothetical protein